MLQTFRSVVGHDPLPFHYNKKQPAAARSQEDSVIILIGYADLKILQGIKSGSFQAKSLPAPWTLRISGIIYPHNPT